MRGGRERTKLQRPLRAVQSGRRPGPQRRHERAAGVHRREARHCTHFAQLGRPVRGVSRVTRCTVGCASVASRADGSRRADTARCDMARLERADTARCGVLHGRHGACTRVALAIAPRRTTRGGVRRAACRKNDPRKTHSLPRKLMCISVLSIPLGLSRAKNW